jgi:glycosyltransferase 2 family protein
VRRPLQIGLQVAVSGAVIGYLLWRLDLEQTADLIASSNALDLLAALAIFIGTTWLMAWRWQLLLAARGIVEPLGWLTKLYFVGYAAGQVLPTAIGGDAVRMIEHARRRPTEKAKAAGAIVIERVLGSLGTLLVVTAGLAVAAGRYDEIGFAVWVYAIFFALTLVFLALLFSRRSGRLLQERVFPLGRRLRLERPLASVYAALHDYRSHAGVLAAVLAISVGVQSVRIIGIWLCGEAVGIDVSPLVYFILGPLLFLVQMVPVTLNGLGVREAFFVAFLSRFDVDKEAALAAGLLFYAATMATALPGGFLLLWRSVRPAAPRPSA